MSNICDNRVKLVLFDLDGTVYLSGKLIPGAKRFLSRLRRDGVSYGFMTNNSSVCPSGYLRKLRGIGLDVGRENIITSAEASVLMLDDFGVGQNIFVLGTKAFKRYLSSCGYYHNCDEAEAVLVGFDMELRYESLCEAVRLIARGVDYYASHPDVVCPSSSGPLPDAGALLAALRVSTGAKPKAIAGKPNRWIVKLACNRFGVKPKNIMIVGDRLQTDIRMANRFGMRSALVLSGVTSRSELNASRYKPDIVVESIGDKRLLEYEF